MTTPSPDTRIAEIRARFAAATDSTSLILSAYDHGGGRLYTQEPERQLIADFYDAANRDFYVQALNDVGFLLDQLAAIPDQIRQAVEAERGAIDSQLEWAWGLIANASHGDWKLESQGWQDGAAKWRDEVMPELSKRTPSVRGEIQSERRISGASGRGAGDSARGHCRYPRR